MVINTKEEIFFSVTEDRQHILWVNLQGLRKWFILHATDVKWTVIVFSIAQMFQQCNFRIASNYSIILEKSVRQEECFATAKFNSYGCDQKDTPQILLYIKFSFHRIICYIFLPFIGIDRRSAVIHKICHGSSQHNSKMHLNSNELQGGIQIHYQTLSSLKWYLPSRYKIHSWVQKWLNWRFARARKQNLRFISPLLYSLFGSFTFPFGFVFAYH